MSISALDFEPIPKTPAQQEVSMFNQSLSSLEINHTQGV